MLVKELSDSFRFQLGCYNALYETVHAILSRLILSRGDFSGVRAAFEEKQRLLDRIETERTRTTGQVRQWQERKSTISGSEDARAFDEVLRQTETAIQRFLGVEEQLRMYLERVIHRE
jgi:hypothetical protein